MYISTVMVPRPTGTHRDGGATQCPALVPLVMGMGMGSTRRTKGPVVLSVVANKVMSPGSVGCCTWTLKDLVQILLECGKRFQHWGGGTGTQNRKHIFSIGNGSYKLTSLKNKVNSAELLRLPASHRPRAGASQEPGAWLAVLTLLYLAL